MGEEPLVQALESFLLAETWEASRAVVDAEPRLLGDDAQRLLRQLMERAAGTGDKESVALLEQHRLLLEQSRRDGVATAFAGLVADDDVLPADILSELAEPPAGAADIPRRIELCRHALAQVARDQDPELWALLQASLGTALMMSTAGDRARNIEESIAALDAAAPEFCRVGLLFEYARTTNNLGLALESRLEGSPDDDLERAIEAYGRALEVFEDPGTAQERAETLNNLANAYNRRQRGLRDENRERAIRLYKEALALIGDERTPTWVRTRLNLGVALIERFRGDRVQNLDDAIEAFRAGLACTDPTIDWTGWANLQANLGNAHARRAAATGDDEDLEQAIVAYEAALEVYGDVRASLNRALTLSNLANALLAEGTPPNEQTVERAIACYREALDILDPDESPLDWGQAQNNLGRAYRERSAGDYTENLELAITAFRRAAEVLNPRNAPVEYAQVMKNLGSAYGKRVRGERPENLERAIDAYEEALQIRTQVYGHDHPRVASILYSMAKVQRSAGDDEGARASLERALAIDEASGGGEPRQHLALGYRRLASTALRLGDVGAAERAIQRALAIDEEAYGPDHPDVFVDLRQLALIREQSGRHGSAVDALERAVTVEELSGGGAHGGVREALADLAELLRKAGDLAGAERTMERAVALDESTFGPDHPRVAESLVKLGDLLNEAHDVSRARETLERAARIEQASGGRIRPRAAAALATLSRTLDAGTPAEPNVPVVQFPRQLPPALPPKVGLRFPETLKGHVAFGVDDPEDGRRLGRRHGTQLDLRLEIVIDDVDRFLDDRSRPAAVTGWVNCPQLGGERPVRRGTYDLQFGTDGSARRTIAYELELDGGEHPGLTVYGLRVVDEDEDADLLRRALSLDVRLLVADGRSAAGVVTVRHLDFIDQLDAIRVDAPTAAGRMAALDRFARAALGPVWDVHGRRGLELAGRAPESP